MRTLMEGAGVKIHSRLQLAARKTLTDSAKIRFGLFQLITCVVFCSYQPIQVLTRLLIAGKPAQFT
jgi:hypothetical protein